jgi:hypothetical protein
MLQKMRQFLAILLTFIIIPLFIDCSETFDEDRYVVINVNFTDAIVTETNRLWAVILLNNNWTGELFRFSSSTNQIIVPLFRTFNLGDITGYVVVAFDSNGDGDLSGEQSIGFDNIGPSNPLSPVTFLEIKTLSLNIDLNAATSNQGPCPFP